jgi:lysine biosynthesis protein LysW
MRFFNLLSEASTMKAQCPECDAWIRVSSSLDLWDTVFCPECDTELQVISINPTELDYADLDEDFEDYEEEEEEGY